MSCPTPVMTIEIMKKKVSGKRAFGPAVHDTNKKNVHMTRLIIPHWMIIARATDAALTGIAAGIWTCLPETLLGTTSTSRAQLLALIFRRPLAGFPRLSFTNGRKKLVLGSASISLHGILSGF